MRPTITLTSSGDNPLRKLADSLAKLTRKSVLVGISATTAGARGAQAKKAAKGGKKQAKSAAQINNAELMYIHTNGSPLRHIPARPVIEPAIRYKANADAIAAELKLAAQAALAGDAALLERQLSLAGMTAENAAKAWFTNPNNHWAPNAPGTIRRKRSSRPLIDTGALRKAITHVVTENG